jgi:hypothetical protein
VLICLKVKSGVNWKKTGNFCKIKLEYKGSNSKIKWKLEADGKFLKNEKLECGKYKLQKCWKVKNTNQKNWIKIRLRKQLTTNLISEFSTHKKLLIAFNFRFFTHKKLSNYGFSAQKKTTKNSNRICFLKNWTTGFSTQKTITEFVFATSTRTQKNILHS